MKSTTKIFTLLLLLAALSLLLVGSAFAEPQVKTFQASPPAVGVNEKFSFTVVTTPDTSYIALFDAAGNKLQTWDAATAAVPTSGDTLQWYVFYAPTEAGKTAFSFAGSADDVTYTKATSITLTVNAEATVITTTGVPEVSNIGNMVTGSVEAYSKMVFKVNTTDNATAISLFDPDGNILATWTEEEHAALTGNGKKLWYVSYLVSGSGLVKYYVKATADGQTYGTEKMTMVNVVAQDLSAYADYLGTWYGETITVDGSEVNLVAEGVRMELTLSADGTVTGNEAGESAAFTWHAENGTVYFEKAPTTLSGDILTVFYDDGKATFGRTDYTAQVDMPDEPLPGEDFWYDATYARLDTYQGYELNLILPREIDGVQLKMIGGGMMNRASHGDNYDVELPVRSVVIPETYEEIPYGAFENCETLETVICYAPLSKLEDGVFRGCTNLREVIFVNGVEAIGVSVFDGCENLETVYIGPGAKTVSDYAFNGSNFDLSRCITDPRELPDVAALLAAVQSDPMPAPEPVVATPIGDEGADYFGVWQAYSMTIGDDIYDVREMGMEMTLTLNPDGTCTWFDGEDTTEDVWTLSEGIGTFGGVEIYMIEDGSLGLVEEGGEILFEQVEHFQYKVAEPIGEEGTAFFGTWLADTMMLDEDVYDLSDGHWVITLTLNADGTCTYIDSGIVTEEVWTLADSEGTFGKRTFTLVEDGSLCLMDQEEIITLFHRVDATETPAAGETQPALERFGVRFVSDSAVVSGYTITGEQLGAQYAMTFSEAGTVKLTLAGTEIPAALPWSRQTIDGQDAFVIDYYGMDMVAVLVDDGFEMDYFGTLIHYAAET